MRAIPRRPAVETAGAALAPPARALRIPRRGWGALIALAVTAAAAIGAIALSGGGAAEHAARPAGPPTIDGASLQAANCTNWWAASAAERGRAIDALTRSIGGPTPYGPGTTLPHAKVHARFLT